VGSTGRAGRLSVTTSGLSITGGGSVASGTAGPGDGGSVTVQVSGPLLIDAAPQGVFANASQGSSGDAGSTAVNAGSLLLTNGGAISSNSVSFGTGGEVAVAVAGTAVLRNAGTISAGNAGSGAGGSVLVSALGPLTVTDTGSAISASAAPT